MNEQENKAVPVFAERMQTIMVWAKQDALDIDPQVAELICRISVTSMAFFRLHYERVCLLTERSGKLKYDEAHRHFSGTIQDVIRSGQISLKFVRIVPSQANEN